MKIVCLFLVDDNCDYLNYNLVAWWQQQPTFSQLQEIFDEKHNVSVNKLLEGKTIRIFDTDYRLETIEEGKIL